MGLGVPLGSSRLGGGYLETRWGDSGGPCGLVGGGVSWVPVESERGTSGVPWDSVDANVQINNLHSNFHESLVEKIYMYN